jgi:hypothetical protein
MDGEEEKEVMEEADEEVDEGEDEVDKERLELERVSSAGNGAARARENIAAAARSRRGDDGDIVYEE